MRKIVNDTDSGLKKSIVKNSLLGQLILLTACIFGFLLAAFAATEVYTKQMLKENILAMNEKILLQIDGKMEDFYSYINHVAAALVYSPTAYDYFNKNTMERIMAQDDLSTVFSNTVLMEEDIAGIYLYDKELNQIAGMGKLSEKPEQVSTLCTELEFGNLFYQKDGTSQYLVFYPVYDIRNQQYGRQIGMCVLVMKNEAFDLMLADGQATEHTRIWLLDGSGQVLAERGADGMEYPDESQTDDAGDYYVQTKELRMEGWKVVSRIPKHELYGSSDRMKHFITAAYAVALLLLLLLVYFCYRRMVLPLRQVDQFIRRNTAEPDQRLEETRGDEIGTVVRSLNRMLDDRERMNLEVQMSQKKMYEAELAEQRMQILAYRNQMNPHFLYNTLEGMREMALVRNAPDVAGMAVDMGNIFRYSSKGSYEVSLEEEIRIIKSYIRIQQMRFRGKIEVYYYISEEVLSLKVIKMLLQPMIENAIVHGLEKKCGPGSLFIGARKEGEKLILTVKDDGIGIAPDRLSEIRKDLMSEQIDISKHVGILNTNARIRLQYGKEYGITLESRENDGTTVTMILPVVLI